MGQDGRDRRAHDASQSAEEAETFDVPPTIVDPGAGRRAAASLARGFHHHEAPTLEATDMVAKLAAHERSMARARGVSPPDPVLARQTPRSFDLRVDALEEVHGPGPQHPQVHEDGDSPDRFDISLSTAGVPVRQPRGRGGWLLGLGLAVALLVGVIGVQQGWLARLFRTAPVSSGR